VPLAPLGRDEAIGYLGARIEAAGGSAEILLAGASAALHELAGGAPGRINALADNALYEAWLAGHAQVARSDVDRAHRDLGWRPAEAEAAGRPTRAQAELTDPILVDEVGAGADLEPELDAVFEPSARVAGGRGSAEAHHTVVMDFDADPELTAAPRRAQAERT